MAPWGPISHSERSVCALSAKKRYLHITAHLCSPALHLALIFSLKVQRVKFFKEARFFKEACLTSRFAFRATVRRASFKNSQLLLPNHGVTTLRIIQTPI